MKVEGSVATETDKASQNNDSTRTSSKIFNEAYGDTTSLKNSKQSKNNTSDGTLDFSQDDIYSLTSSRSGRSESKPSLEKDMSKQLAAGKTDDSFRSKMAEQYTKEIKNVKENGLSPADTGTLTGKTTQAFSGSDSFSQQATKSYEERLNKILTNKDSQFHLSADQMKNGVSMKDLAYYSTQITDSSDKATAVLANWSKHMTSRVRYLNGYRSGPEIGGESAGDVLAKTGDKKLAEAYSDSNVKQINGLVRNYDGTANKNAFEDGRIYHALGAASMVATLGRVAGGIAVDVQTGMIKKDNPNSAQISANEDGKKLGNAFLTNTGRGILSDVTTGGTVGADIYKQDINKFKQGATEGLQNLNKIPFVGM